MRPRPSSLKTLPPATIRCGRAGTGTVPPIHSKNKGYTGKKMLPQIDDLLESGCFLWHDFDKLKISLKGGNNGNSLFWAQTISSLETF